VVRSSAASDVYKRQKQKNAQAALDAFATYASNLAKQLGYKVTSS
jgi:hypothetical protein